MPDTTIHDPQNDPVNHVEWRDARTLRGNDWNPNYVLNQELRLLERSIIRDGWTAPIIIADDGEVIDGFHRWRLSLDSRSLVERYKYFVPCVVLDLSPRRRKAVTIRMNRARGTHMAVRMSSLVKSLVNSDDLDPQEVADELGMDADEVDLLLQEDVFTARNLSEYRYSRAWQPKEKR